MVEIKGTIEKVIFHNPDNGYTVLNVTVGISKLSVVCRGMVEPQEETTYVFKGDWKDSKWGRQLDACEYEEVLPSEINAIEKYLSSGLIKGIGPVYAKKIVEALGKETLNIIDSKSDEIFKIKGIGKKKVEAIWTAWDEHRYLRSLIAFLKDYDISTNFIVKIYHRYGNDSIDIIKANPYRLIRDIDGLGFARVDRLAIKLGYERTGIERCKAGVIYILQEQADDGNVFSTKDFLIANTAVLLEVEDNYVENAIFNLINEGLIIDDNDDIYLTNLYRDEISVADKLMSMTYYDAPDYPCDIAEIEKETNIEYDDIQKEGIKTAVKSGVSVITGGPGTGKTTILLGAIKALQKQNIKIAAAAPTGKAAKRMAELTGLDAKTIHRLLLYRPDVGYTYNEQNLLPYDVVIIDETSMVNLQLMSILLEAISIKTKLILVGDVDQLPAIGPGNVLLDIINSHVVPVVKLEKIYRQAESSDIVVNAHKVNNGELPAINNMKPNTDFFFIKETNYDSVLRMIPDLVKNRLSKKYETNPYDIQVLSPMRKDDCGAINLNKILQEALNPEGPSINYGGTTFRLGDKVMQIKNNYEKGIFNGETGKIIDVNTTMRELTVDFDGNVIYYSNGDFDEIVLAYACTIHKSQGSEFPVVVIPIMRAHYNMMQRNLIYTAITRAKNICVMMGDVDMLKRAVGNVSAKKRNTKLEMRLSMSPRRLENQN